MQTLVSSEDSPEAQELQSLYELMYGFGIGVAKVDASGAPMWMNPYCANVVMALSGQPFLDNVWPTLCDKLPGLEAYLMHRHTAGRAFGGLLDIPAGVIGEGEAMLLLRVAHTDDGCFHLTVANSSEFMRDERARHHNELFNSRHFDPLTQLPNRLATIEHVHSWCRRHREGRAPFLVCKLDLHGFNRINLSHGHATGDVVLQLLAKRLRQLGAGYFSARVGGDAFVVVTALSGDAADHDAVEATLSQRLQALCAKPFLVDGVSLYVTLRLGLVRARPDDTPELLLSQAKAALLEAKVNASGQEASVFQPVMQQRASRQQKLADDLRRVLETSDPAFWVAYQPVCHLVQGHKQVQGVEALARWTHPALGDIAPAEFIPLAEEVGLIQALGKRVLELASADMNAVRRATGAPVELALNVSVRQMENDDWLLTLGRYVAEGRLDPAHTVLEVTESMTVSHPDVVQRIHQLKALGFRISLDDFGTGYSSLSRLQALPVDVIKIDQSFVRNLSGSAFNEALIVAILRVAQSLQLSVVAEGVETPDSAQQLQSLGCPLAQGFALGHPMPMAKLVSWLTSSTFTPPTESVL